jgi:hypothetical protein
MFEQFVGDFWLFSLMYLCLVRLSHSGMDLLMEILACLAIVAG